MTTIDGRTAAMLAGVRALAEEIAPREAGLYELRTRSIGSPAMDGMPRGGGARDANAERLARIERVEQAISRDKRRLERKRQEARRAIRTLDARRRIFYTAYYIDADKASAARVLAGVSQRTAMRYIKDIKKEAGG